MTNPGSLLRVVAALCVLACSSVFAADARVEALPEQPQPGTAFATFAGGCFWCMEAPFDKLDGVLETISGHTGGHVPHVTYQQVSRGNTGHAEAVRVIYDPDRITYQALLDVYWRQIDPTTPDRQFCDRGSQYRPEIFVHTEQQRVLALASRKAMQESGRFDGPIQVPVTRAATIRCAITTTATAAVAISTSTGSGARATTEGLTAPGARAAPNSERAWSIVGAISRTDDNCARIHSPDHDCHAGGAA